VPVALNTIIETVRNNLAATADAQDAGAFALSLLSVQIGNAGAGIAGAARWLETCPSATDVAASLRPISVLISDSGSADQPDSIALRTARAPQMATPAAFATEALSGANFHVESPDGLAAGDRIYEWPLPKDACPQIKSVQIEARFEQGEPARATVEVPRGSCAP